MAVKRKRVTEETSDEEVSPKKKGETYDEEVAPKKKGETSDEEVAPKKKGETSDEEVAPKKQFEPFSVTAFRKSLQGPNSFTALREFVHQSNSSCEQPDVALQYLEGGGSALELLQVSSGNEAWTMSQYETIFSALQVLIMRTLTHSPHHQLSMEEACRHLINSHLKAIHLLCSSRTRNKKTVLKLLTAMVSLSAGIARDVLSHLKFSTLGLLTKQAEPHERQSVRTCFIHFLMAFLVDGDVSIIRSLLDKKGLLGSIMPEMIYDRADVVALVLTTLRTKLLENTGMSKTLKLHTFNTQVIQNLLALYHWQGPTAWKRPTKKRRKHEVPVEVPEEEREFVVEMVHQLLLVLCCSHKYGVAFRDHSIGTSRKRHNELIHSVLLTMQQPWEQQRPAELVVRILAACPDLVRGVMTSMEPFLEPRASRRWLQAVSFVEKVVQALDPKVYLQPYAADLPLLQLVSSVQALTVPVAVLRSVQSESLLHPNPAVRHAAVHLLSSLLTRLRDALACLDALPTSELQQLQHSIATYLAKYLPGGSVICETWKKALEPDVCEGLSEETLDVPSPVVHFSTLLDLLLLYQQCCPHLLEFGLDMHSFVHKVRDLKETHLHVKMYQLLLAMNSEAFTPDKELFSEALVLLLDAMCDPSPEVGLPARDAAIALLLASGLFDGTRGELSVWLHCHKSVPSECRGEVSVFLALTMVKVAQNPSAFLEMVATPDSEPEEDSSPDQGLQEVAALDDFFEELMEDRDHWEVDGNSLPNYSVRLSPLLSGALEQAAVDHNSVVIHYVSCVVIHLLHNQTTPATILHVVDRWPDLLPTSVQQYLQSWSPKGTPAPLRKPFCSQSPESRLSRALLRPEDGSACRSLVLEDGSPDPNFMANMDPDHLLLLVKLCVFYLAQLTSSRNLSEDVCNRSREALTCLLSALGKADGNDAHYWFMGESFKTALTHPLLLCYFSPLSKKKHVLEKLVTKLLLDLLQLATKLLDGAVVDNLMAPFRQRLLRCIAQGVRRTGRGLQDSGLLLSAVELLHLGQEDITELLGLVVSIPGENLVRGEALSPWGELLTHLLQHAGAQPAETIAAVASYLVELSSCEGLAPLEDGLHHYLLQFPHSLAVVPASLLEMVQPRPSMIRLCALMLERSSALGPAFKVQVQNPDSLLLVKPEVFLPLLLAALIHGEDRFLLDTACTRFEVDIALTVLKPHETPDWVQPNISILKMIVEKSLGVGKCKKVCDRISRKARRLYKCENFHLDLIVSIYARAGLSPARVLLNQLTNALKQASMREDRARHLCRLLSGCLDNIPFINGIAMRELLSLTLKFGMRPQMEVGHLPLLSIITKVLHTVYTVNEWNSVPEACLVYEMVLSHSEFLNLMLGDDKDTKRELLQLLLVLVKQDKSVVQSAHAPILLSAYGATLAVTDQLILQLLRQYEVSGASLHSVRPYLWGEAAASHYSVRSSVGLALWRQPHTSQVLELLDLSCVERTVTHFPVHRQLQVLDDNHKPRDDLYDPAFLLPLFSHLLASEAVVYPHVFSQKGGLALTLAGLGSCCAGVRAASGHVLARYHSHLEAGRITKEKQLVLQFVNAVRGGVADISNTSALPEHVPQMTCVAATFLARASLMMSQPLNPLYKPLHTYILALPALKLNVVPELLELLHGHHIEFRLGRHWILEVLRDGLRTKCDVEIYFKSPVFKLLLSLYSSVLCDGSTKVLILQTLESTLRLPTVALRLVSSHGLLPWLHQAVQQLRLEDTELTSAMVCILATLPAVACADCLLLLKALLPKLSPALPPAKLHRYLQALTDVQDKGCVLGVEHLRILLLLAGQILDSMGHCEDLLLYGYKFAAPSVPALESKEDEAKILLRQITLTCLQHMDSSTKTVMVPM